MREIQGAAEDYLRELETRFGDLDLGGRRVLLDCAHGATHRVGPRSSAASAPRSRRWATTPTGATSTRASAPRTSRTAAPEVREGRFDLGFAFDGDGDRVLALDRHGRVVDGDELIALAALHLRGAGRLRATGWP